MLNCCSRPPDRRTVISYWKQLCTGCTPTAQQAHFRHINLCWYKKREKKMTFLKNNKNAFDWPKWMIIATNTSPKHQPIVRSYYAQQLQRKAWASYNNNTLTQLNQSKKAGQKNWSIITVFLMVLLFLIEKFQLQWGADRNRNFAVQLSR